MDSVQCASLLALPYALPDADAERIGARSLAGMLSAQTLRKQEREYPELRDSEYLEAQSAINEATHTVQDSDRSLLYVLDRLNAGGYVLAVKATVSGKGTFISSFRRLSREQAKRDAEIQRLLAKSLNE